MRPDFAPRRRFRAIASWRLAGVALVLAATTRAAAQTSVVGQWATPVAWPLAASSVNRVVLPTPGPPVMMTCGMNCIQLRKCVDGVVLVLCCEPHWDG